jgi:hypothetical protein
MKTSYEKMKKLSGYILDIMYMFKLYNDNYPDLAKYRSGIGGQHYIPHEKGEKIRSYRFSFGWPEVNLHNAITYDEGYDRLITITSSKNHIKNFTSPNNSKYRFVLSHMDCIDNLYRNFDNDFAIVYNMILEGIDNDSMREAEFQALLVGDQKRIDGAYLVHFVHDHLKMFKDDISTESILALGTTDVLRFVPARKALIELMAERCGNDWRSKIKNRYGYDVK